MPAAAVSASPPPEPSARADAQAGENERAIDLVHLARATDGDESLEAELLSMFDRQSEKLSGRMKLPELPRSARADIAHRLRGSALAIGAFTVAEAAEAVEAALEADDDAETEIVALDRAVAAARATIAELSR